MAIERQLIVKGSLYGKAASMVPGPCPHFFVQDEQELGFFLNWVSGAAAGGKLGIEWLGELRAERFHLKKRDLPLKMQKWLVKGLYKQSAELHLYLKSHADQHSIKESLVIHWLQLYRKLISILVSPLNFLDAMKQPLSENMLQNYTLLSLDFYLVITRHFGYSYDPKII